jgi:hypothetical protein
LANSEQKAIRQYLVTVKDLASQRRRQLPKRRQHQRVVLGWLDLAQHRRDLPSEDVDAVGPVGDRHEHVVLADLERVA